MSPALIKMPLASLSLLCHRSRVIFPSTTTTTLCRLPFIPILAKQNPHRLNQPSKNELRARDTAPTKKPFSSLSSLSSKDRPTLSPDQAVGTVASAQANFMRVIVQSAPPPPAGDDAGRVGAELLCVVKAVLKKIRRKVLVGDKVLVSAIDWVDRRGWIENVFDRSSEILDPPVANVDHLLVLFSLDQPKIEPFTLTRFLVEAESTGIPLSLALNKTELVDEEVIQGWRSRIRSWGYEPILCSVERRRGLDTLTFTLIDRTTVVVGPSGVGKSSLINSLRNREHPFAIEEEIPGSKSYEEQKVGEVSARSGRGKHTTRNVSLLPLPEGGYLADTPGFNQPSLIKVTKQSLAKAFPEIEKMVNDSETKKCAFNDCLHIGELGCAVTGDWERYPFYFQLLDEIRIREEFQLRTWGTKRESDVRLKAGDMGVMQAEPRLEPKKHRRQSRKRINQSVIDELNELDDEEDDYMDPENPILQAADEDRH
ncbi:hypothetical protein V2J09_013791 [Rumex salicifolius]